MEYLVFETLQRDEPEKCKGLFYRGHTNKYWNGYKLSFSKELRFLKRRSCTGCVKCDWYYEQIKELLYIDAIILPEIKNGQLYSVKCVVTSTDWETGYADDWVFEFYEVKE